MSDATDAGGNMPPIPGTPLTPPPQASPPHSTPPEPTLEEQARTLMRERGYAAEVALQLATTWKCEQCTCAIGVPRGDNNDCECPCHCSCCCPGLFRCFTDCECVCADDCHYDPAESDDESTRSGASAASPHTQEPAQPPKQPDLLGSATGESKQAGLMDGDGDAAMPERPLTEMTLAQLYDELRLHLNGEMQDDDADAKAGPYAAAVFEKLYANAVQTGMKPQKDNALPSLKPTEGQLLLALMRVLFTQDSTLQKFTAAITDVVRTSFRSSWKLERILADRRQTAMKPAATGPNAWSQKTPSALQATLAADTAKYRFDPTVYSGEETERLRTLCGERYAFADTTRKPIGDEWTIIMGIMSGTIVIRALPQFLKRCSNMRQFQWFHRQMVLRAEGELYAQLPPQAKIFDYNQTAKRLTDTILSAADYQNLDATALKQMLQSVKTISYNDEMKAIHFYFDTKLEALQWEGMDVPFRNFKLALKNPDARYREIQESPTGERRVVIRQPKDGLQDNRYDNLYRLRCTNLTRTMEMDKFAQFLNDYTDGGIKMGAPIDSYGANSEYSLTWDFFAHGHSCPEALRNVNRIMWREHAILIIHQGRPSAAPCHQCAATGHQASSCTKDEDYWFSESTVMVSDEMIAAVKTTRTTWTTPDEARQLFDLLGDAEPVQLTTDKQSNGTAPAVADTTSTALEQPGADASTKDTEVGQPPVATSETESPQAAPTSSGPGSGPGPTGTGTLQTLESEGNGSDQTKESHDIGKGSSNPQVSSGWKTAMSRYSRNKTRQGQTSGSTNHNGTRHTGARQNNGTDHAAASKKAEPNRQRQRARGGTRTRQVAPESSNDGDGGDEGEEADEDDEDEDDGEDDEDDEDEDNDDSKGTQHDTAHRQSDAALRAAPGSTKATSGVNQQTAQKESKGSRNRRLKHQALQRREEDDALEAAIARNNMTRTGMTILRNSAATRQPMDTAVCLAAIAKAQADSERVQTSRNGTIEAVGGTLVLTPSTGNCQYAAIAESLFQLAFAAKKDQDLLVECVMMLKFVIYLAAAVDIDVEQSVCNLAAILDFPASEVDRLTDDELKKKLAAHYAAVATSSLELNHLLPVELWGRTDSLRLMAKGLGRTIFVITESSTPDIVHHHLFKPQRIKDKTTNTTIPSAVMQQLGYQEWLSEIKADVEAGETPIIISYAKDHYNAVLLNQPTHRTHSRPPTKRQTITELWGSATPNRGAEGSKPGDKETGTLSEEQGPTRSELVASQSAVLPHDIFRALSQDNWSRQEKKAAIEALVLGKGRLKELLAFCDGASDMSDEQSEPEGEDMDTKADFVAGSDSTFTPPSQSPEEPSSPDTREGQASEEAQGSQQSATSDAPSVYSLPTPGPDDDYMRWAQEAWGRLCDEWAGQDGIQPPVLADRQALAKFVATYPEVMTELGQQHPNPFIVLEHLRDADIKGWCAKKRFRYCVAELEQVIGAIASEPARRVLTDWLADIRSPAKHTDQIKKYRDSAKWATLTTEAGELLSKRTLLSRDYSKESAFVMALEELFPDLASDILRAEGQETSEGMGLGRVYEQGGGFKVKVTQSIKAKRWEPLVEYVRGLGVHLSQPPVPGPVGQRC